MPAPANDTLQLTLRLSCEDVPPAEYQGRAMEFGAQDKAGALHAGTTEDDGGLAFVLPVAAQLPAPGGEVDFSGTFVHGSTSTPTPARTSSTSWSRARAHSR